MTGRYDPENMATPSSGNVEQDRAVIDGFIRRSMRLDEGLCPNHADRPVILIQRALGERECPDCGFTHFRAALA